MPAFGAAIKPLGMQHAIHLGRARRGVEAVAAREGCGERLGVGAPALEAGAMTGSERSRLIEEEQFGVTAPPDLAMTALEFEPAADPGARHPAPQAEGAIVTMKTSAAVAEQRPSRGVSKQVAERIHAVRKRHERATRKFHHSNARVPSPDTTGSVYCRDEG